MSHSSHHRRLAVLRHQAGGVASDLSYLLVATKFTTINKFSHCLLTGTSMIEYKKCSLNVYQTYLRWRKITVAKKWLRNGSKFELLHIHLLTLANLQFFLNDLSLRHTMKS